MKITALILTFSIALVVLVTWFVPSLAAASLNILFRLRGTIHAPTDLVILAIDDHSLQRVGHWPWPRAVMASALDKLTQAQPRSVGLDVIYAEPSTPADDQQLAAAIARNGRVVLPAQLYETSKNSSLITEWLRPLPAFAAAARSLGHAHISPEVDGMVRSIQLSKADDRANRLWAFGLEVLRVAEQFAADDVEEQVGWLRFGAHRIPVRDETVGAPLPGVSIIRQNEMLINFAGPAGSFRYYSIADLLDDKIPPATFSGKLVLIGAGAESMGDSRVVPFMHYSAAEREGGQEMPGVEIHANIINTIRGRLSLRALPDWLAFAVALAVIVLSALVIRRFDGWRQLALLGLILLAILVGSYVAFSRFLIVPPLAPMLTGFAAVIPLLLNRALAASRELDIKLAALVRSQQGFLTAATRPAADFIDNQLKLDLPQSLAWKLRAVDELTAGLLARMSFINRILSSMGEGVLVTDLAGQIVFANGEARQLFGAEQTALLGANLADLLIERGALDAAQLQAAIKQVAEGRAAQLEFALNAGEPRYYSFLLSALLTGSEVPPVALSPASSQPLGIVALISDITKRVELDRMKTETLQLVSHELRTPLTSIQGLSDVLLKFPVPAAESREMLNTIHAEAVRLGETINRYLDLTRLESGAQPLQLTPVSCEQLIADCVRNLSVFAAERQIRLTAKIEPDLPTLQADAQLLIQAIGNLLSNAIKYSPPETEVTVSATAKHGSLIINVCDQGYGIPEEVRERVFEKFYRLQRDTAAGVIGTGLGLPLVKEIVERHGGRIALENNPSAGTTFTIQLPLQAASFPSVGR